MPLKKKTKPNLDVFKIIFSLNAFIVGYTWGCLEYNDQFYI